MTEGPTPEPTPTTDGSGPWAGAAIALGSLMALAVMSHHPSVRADSDAAFIEAVLHLATLNRIVHGGALAAIGLLVLGLWTFSDRLGRTRMTARAGWLAYVVGALCMGFAALANGFVIVAIAERFARASAAELDVLMTVLAYTGEAVETVERLSVIALCLAVSFWSTALVQRGGSARLLGGIGWTVGLVPVVLLAAGRLPMTVAGYGGFIAAQTIWYLAIAVQLMRRRL